MLETQLNADPTTTPAGSGGAREFVCAFRYRDDAMRLFEVLPHRLAKFGLEVAVEKTQVVRLSRFHPSMRRRITFLGFELFWFEDRAGVPRVKRRTACRKLQGAAQRLEDWIKSHRHLPARAFIRGPEPEIDGSTTASTTEAPDAGKPHVRDCAGGAG